MDKLMDMTHAELIGLVLEVVKSNRETGNQDRRAKGRARAKQHKQLETA